MTKPQADSYRSCKHAILLYPDDVTHVAALEVLKQGYDFAGILHDKDKDEDEKPKKVHWHVVLRTKSQTWNTALAKELKIERNYIQCIRNEEKALAYLIHFNEENKHQYEIQEVFGSEKAIKAVIKATGDAQLAEGEKVMTLLEDIQNADKPISLMSFAKSCAKEERWDIFRRSATIFLKLIEEHNQILREERNRESRESNE